MFISENTEKTKNNKIKIIFTQKEKENSTRKCDSEYIIDNIDSIFSIFKEEDDKKIINILSNEGYYNKYNEQKIYDKYKDRYKPQKVKNVLYSIFDSIKKNVLDATLVSRKFYKDLICIYEETPNESAGNSKYVTKLEYENKICIGYRYHLPDGKYFSAVIDKGEDGLEKYKIVRGPGLEKEADILNKIKKIYSDHYKDKFGYEITGSGPKTPGIVACLAEKQNFNSPCIVSSMVQKSNDLWDKNLTEETLLERTGINKMSGLPPNVVLVPVAAKAHATLLCIDRTNGKKIILLDSSLAHTTITDDNNKNDDKVNSDIFGDDLSAKIGIPTKFSIQINGTCSYWVDSLMEVIVTNSEKYKNINSISKAAENGDLWVEAAVIMSEKFDEKGEETIKQFDNENAAKNANYIPLKTIDGKLFCINKNCCNNKFIRLEYFVKLLSNNDNNLEQQLKQQIEVQNEIKNFGFAIHEGGKMSIYESSIKKIIEEREKEKEKIDGVLNKVQDKWKEERKKDKSNYDRLKEYNPGKTIVKVIQNNTFDKLIKDITDRYKSLKKEFNELIGEINKNPAITSEELCKLQLYEKLKNNLDKETIGEIIGPRHLKSFRKLYDGETKNTDKSVTETECIQSDFVSLKSISIPYIKDLEINKDPDTGINTIIFKTDNKKIFRDIEEIRITLPKENKEINDEYLNKLYKEIVNKSFNNDMITLNNVEIKRKNKTEYEIMGKYTNAFITNEYRINTINKYNGLRGIS